LDESRIDQRGERWKPLLSPFAVLDEPHLNKLKAGHTGVLTS
jgi:hypothetical protein